MIEAGETGQKLVALELETRQGMQPEIKKRRPEDIRDGHQLEVIGCFLPDLRARLNVCAQSGVSIDLDQRRALLLQVFHRTRRKILPGAGARRPGELFLKHWKQRLQPSRYGLLLGQ